RHIEPDAQPVIGLECMFPVKRAAGRTVTLSALRIPAIQGKEETAAGIFIPARRRAIPAGGINGSVLLLVMIVKAFRTEGKAAVRLRREGSGYSEKNYVFPQPHGLSITLIKRPPQTGFDIVRSGGIADIGAGHIRMHILTADIAVSYIHRPGIAEFVSNAT